MIETVKAAGARAGLGLSALGGMLLVGFVLAGPASATSDPVAEAFTSMQGKITTYGAAIVALVVLATAIFLGIKYLQKGVNKA